MNIEDIREYCTRKEYSFESTPFDEDTLAYKVGTLEQSKIFALISMTRNNYLILKCDPEIALDLRERYSEIEGAFHMNKRYWNGVLIDGNLSDDLIYTMIDDSYNLIYEGLSKKIKSELSLK